MSNASQAPTWPLHESKLRQAVRLLQKHDLDAWLVLTRETTVAGDPVLPLILPGQLTWTSALLVSRSGERIAIVGRLDDDAVRATGLFDEVIGYVEDIGPSLIATLQRLDPQRIGLNYSVDDVLADGLSHGMHQRLCELLEATRWRTRLCSAAPMVAELRAVKNDEEIARVRAAIATTEAMYARVPEVARQGVSEVEVAAFMKAQASAAGHPLAWHADMCPIVNAGAGSMLGHGVPSADLRLAPGAILHMDFGVVVDGYCSDIQRCWYLPEPNELGPPAAVAQAFETICKAIDAAAATLRPGTPAWQVDEAARKVLVDAGFPAYLHATGHHVGRCAHDGGAILGPRWPRYGKSPERTVEVGHVYTLEPTILDADGRGCMGIEEMVLVTAQGCEFLTHRQTELWSLNSRTTGAVASLSRFPDVS